MACLLTSSYNFAGCKGGAGGIANVYITEFANKPTIVKTANVITTITMPGSTKFRKYLLDKEMGYFTNPGAYTEASGTIHYEPEVGFTIKSLTTTMVQEMHLMAQNTVLIIVEELNGTCWLFGYNKGMDLTTWGAESGTAINDFKGQKMVFKGKDIEPMLEMDKTLLAAIIV